MIERVFPKGSTKRNTPIGQLYEEVEMIEDLGTSP